MRKFKGDQCAIDDDQMNIGSRLSRCCSPRRRITGCCVECSSLGAASSSPGTMQVEPI